MNPVVSVIVPCYNQAPYLSEALDSVLAQSYNNWECIIVNDGSTDHTEQVALDFCCRDSRFRYILKENEDVSAARNAGIEVARGKFILPLDGDDKVAPNYIGEAVKVLSDDETVKLVYCKAEFFGAKTGLWNLPEYSLKKLLEYNIIFITALFRKEDWFNVKGFDGSVDGAEDWDFWISILKNGGKVICLPFVGFYYRKKGLSKFTSLTDEDRIRHRDYVYTKHAAAIQDVYGNPIQLSYKVQSLELEIENLKKFYDKVTSSTYYKVTDKFKKLLLPFSNF